jgi:hypothetical protein
MTLDLEVNEVEVKGLTSLASVTWITGLGRIPFRRYSIGLVYEDRDAALGYRNLNSMPRTSISILVLPVSRFLNCRELPLKTGWNFTDVLTLFFSFCLMRPSVYSFFLSRQILRQLIFLSAWTFSK